MASVIVTCFHCYTENSFADAIQRKEECLKCSSDLHVCKNCQFYDVSAYNECREQQADLVRDRERANFCDYFRPIAGGSAMDDAAKLRAAAEALFKK